MNFYLLHPHYFRKERLSVLCEILKVRRVFDLAGYGMESVFCTEKEVADEQVVKAVAILSVRMEKGVDCIQEDSNPYNPVYNLEHCDDSNVLVLVPNVHVAYLFAHCVTRYLEKRICILYFEHRDMYGKLTGLTTSVYRDGEFDDVDSFISYIRSKLEREPLEFFVRKETVDEMAIEKEYEEYFNKLITENNHFVQQDEGFVHPAFLG